MNFSLNASPDIKMSDSGQRRSKLKMSFSLIAQIIFIISIVFFLILTLIQKFGEPKVAAIVNNYVVPIENCYCYTQLDEDEKHIYEELLKAAPSGTDTFEISNVSADDYKSSYTEKIENAVNAFTNDHPEFFWLGNSFTSEHASIAKKITLRLYQYEFWKKSFDKEELANKFFSRVNEIVAEVPETADSFERVKFVHDYLIANISYDHSAAEDNDDGKWSLESSYAFTGYGGIVNGRCVCGGYSEAFQIILQRMGYECTYVSGETQLGLHAWNVIKLDGEYYYFDVTWDDVEAWTNSDGATSFLDGNRHDYFAVTTAEFSKEHTDKYFNYPLCTATYYNYFFHEDYTVFSFSEKKINDIIEKQLSENFTDISLKFTDEKTMNSALSYLRSGALQKLFINYGYSGRYLAYSNNNMLVFTFIPGK